MPAPYPRRGPQQANARAVNRGAKGPVAGRAAGVSPVSRVVRQRGMPPEASSGSAAFIDAGKNLSPSVTMSDGVAVDLLTTLSGGDIDYVGDSSHWDYTAGYFTVDAPAYYAALAYVKFDHIEAGDRVWVQLTADLTEAGESNTYYYGDSWTSYSGGTELECGHPLVYWNADTPFSYGWSLYATSWKGSGTNPIRIQRAWLSLTRISF